MNTLPAIRTPRRKAIWGPKRTLAVTALAWVGLTGHGFAAGAQHPSASKATPGAPTSRVRNYKLDDEVTARAARGNPLETSSVIVTLVPGADLPTQFKQFARGARLDIINGQVLELPNGVLKHLAAHPEIFRVHDNRPLTPHNYRTSVTVGARTVHETLGYTGAGIGVAVLDSGVATWHDDLTSNSSTLYEYGNQRVSKFVDFVNGGTQPYDDNGHGSHVAGTILGNGYDSKGEKAGIAPAASLVSLKVLDRNGQGTISNIIAALNWVVANHKTYNVRVVNLSVGAVIRESYWTDPLTIATKAVTDQGITVVVAAGNLGKNANGQLQLGGITAPGNAPWVLTVGASSTMGTLKRNDDEMAPFSSAGPSFIDFAAKPDLVAPGTGTVSLAVPGSAFYATKAQYLVDGKLALGAKPYLALSGTSMAAPVVTGTVALMLQANPTLTPNLIKAILQYTAQEYPGYSPLRQGAGFLNSLGAVRLAKFYAANRVGERLPVQKVWSRQIIWGSHRLTGGYLNPRANAWTTSAIWGSAQTALYSGDNIVWGTRCGDGACDNIVWGTRDATGDNIVWGTTTGDNIVWGTTTGDNIVWGTVGSGDNIVWGTWGAGDNIVWGTDCGGSDCDNAVWGAAAGDNIVWGTAAAGDNIVWGTGAAGDNIVWGTSDSGAEAVLFPEDGATEPLPSVQLDLGDIVSLPGTSTSTTSSGGGF